MLAKNRVGLDQSICTMQGEIGRIQKEAANRIHELGGLIAQAEQGKEMLEIQRLNQDRFAPRLNAWTAWRRSSGPSNPGTSIRWPA